MTKRSQTSLAKRMAANNNPHHFGVIHNGTVLLPEFGRLRYSRIAKLLPPTAQVELEHDRVRAAHCPTHGALEDPAIMIVGSGKDGRVAFICPHCSGENLLSQWEREGLS